MGPRTSMYLFFVKLLTKKKLHDVKWPSVPLKQAIETKTHVGHIHFGLLCEDPDLVFGDLQ